MMNNLSDIRIDYPNNIVETKYNTVGPTDSNMAPHLNFDYNQYLHVGTPTTNIDLNYFASYINQIEYLRTQTFSTNAGLESALVPHILHCTIERIKDSYIYNNDVQTVNKNKKEFVFKVQKIGIRNVDQYVISDDTRYIYIKPKLGENINDILEYIPTVNFTMSEARLRQYNDELKYYNNDMKLNEEVIINTSIKATLYNYYRLGCLDENILLFINGFCIPWTKIYVYWDNNSDMYLSVYGDELDSFNSYIKDSDVEVSIIRLPFKVLYLSEYDNIDDYPEIDVMNTYPLFNMYPDSGHMITNNYYDTFNHSARRLSMERIFVTDENILFTEIVLDVEPNGTNAVLGHYYNLRTGIDKHYRLNQFNFQCYEDGILKNDYTIKCNNFNIIDITMNQILNKYRIFKIFYNKNVQFVQDNIFKVKNTDILYSDFVKYLIRLRSSIDLFIQKIYDLKEQDTDDKFKIRMEYINMNNMEEGSTPYDEFIYYESAHLNGVLKRLVIQLFETNDITVINTLNNLIDRAYEPNYNAVNPQLGYSVKNEWFLRENLSEMFNLVNDDYTLSNIELVNESFDFSHSMDKTYKQNITDSADYILSYDSDKLEDAIVKPIDSIILTGAEVSDYIEADVFTYSRRNHKYSNNENYVMIFKNGLLHYEYNSIAYTKETFSVTMFRVSFEETDVFEIVYFYNINNKIIDVNYDDYQMPTIIRPGGIASIGQLKCAFMNSDIISPEDISVFVDRLPNNSYNGNINFTNKPLYKVNFYMSSLKPLPVAAVDGSLEKHEYMRIDYTQDSLQLIGKVNNSSYYVRLHDEIQDNITLPYKVTLASNKQFRYDYIKVNQNTDNYKIVLSDEFKCCTDTDNLMIFKNSRLLPKGSILTKPTNGTPISKREIYLNIPVVTDDILEVFYVNSKLNLVTNKVTNRVAVLNENNQPIDQINSGGYIRFNDTVYGICNKNTLLVFINGIKINKSQLENISNTIIKVTSDIQNVDRLELYSFIDITKANKILHKDALSHYEPIDGSLVDKSMKIDMSTLPNYNTPSTLDVMINNTSDDNLNILFDTTNVISNTNPIVDGNQYSKQHILSQILADNVISGDSGDWVFLL